ncbi:MAG: hypothetical protein HY646_08125 [Acidobacteria bacterium]|nr:hypothetical protein [Acidobacteriota bacterium]
MPTRTISLTPDQDGQEDALKLKLLREQIRAGVDALQRGDFVEVDEADLETYLGELTLKPRKRSR